MGKQAIMIKMVGLVHTLVEENRNNNPNVFGEILHEGWMLKKTILSEISNTGVVNCIKLPEMQAL